MKDLSLAERVAAYVCGGYTFITPDGDVISDPLAAIIAADEDDININEEDAIVTVG